MIKYDLLNLVNMHDEVYIKKIPFKNQFKKQNNVFLKNVECIQKVKSSDCKLIESSNWIIDNLFLIENEALNLLHDDYMNVKYFDCVKFNNKFSPRIYVFCLYFLQNQKNIFNEREFFEELNEYEERLKLKLREISSTPFFLKYSIIQNIYDIVDSTAKIELEKLQGKSLFNSIMKLLGENKIKLALKKLGKFMGNSPSLYSIEYFMDLLRENNVDDKNILECVEKTLKNENLNILSLKEGNENSLNTMRIKISMYIQSLRNISLMNWKYELEKINSIHKEFLKDPAGIYPNMDYDSRNFYRLTLQKICEENNLNEYLEACKIVNLSISGNSNYSKHVGYYLIDEGSKIYKSISFKRSFGKLLYFLCLFVGIIFSEILLLKYTSSIIDNIYFSIGMSIVLLIIVSDVLINFINYIFLRKIPRKFVPKMDYSKKIPDEAKTMVIIPSLLTSKEDIDKVFKNLELSYICNKNKNIYFGILFDYVDAISYEGFDDKNLYDYAKKSLNELNERYKYKLKETKFYMFVRNKIYSDSNKTYMGWERKRGKIMEFIKFLKGRESSFFENFDDYPLLKDIRYIITIDSDNKLKKDSAWKLIGSIHHVLNRAVIKNIKKRNKVVRGYGIIQPKVTVAFKSSLNTLYSKLFVGNVATSSYNSISANIYQDLFFESIFTGKGIIDIEVFDRILWDVIPENTILSHDLIEGCFSRVLLSSDIEIEEDFPSNILSSFSRLHRWVRGDWQLISYLVKGRGINKLSKYKILDNLRRSLVPISYLLCMIFPFFLDLRGRNLYYGIILLGFLFPCILDLTSLCAIPIYKESILEGASDLKNKLSQVYVMFSLIPYQGFMLIDAIIRSLVRLLFTKKNLLEWKTFQEVEKTSKVSLVYYFKKMSVVVLFGIIVLGLSIKLKVFEMIIPSITFLTIPIISYYLSKEYKIKEEKISNENNIFLKAISRSIFAYFEDFVNESTNYLVCDNYQEDPAVGIIKKTSPTNIGMSISSFIIGRDFGFITIVDMVDRVKNIINSLDALPIYRGHLYNWYDIEKCVPIGERYVSTVDSGNLLASYYLSKKSLEDILNKPLIHRDLVKGFEEMCYLSNNFNKNHSYKEIIDLGYKCESFTDYIGFLNKIIDKSNENISELIKENEDVYWHIKINESSNSFLQEILSITCKINEMSSFKINKFGELFIKSNLCSLQQNLLEFKKNYNNSSVRSEVIDEKISKIIENVKNIVDDINFLIVKISSKINGMDFKFLYRNERGLFSIGYDCENDVLDENCYDLLASEVRIASFLSIAKGDVPLSHWFKLGRVGVNLRGIKTLVSWSGTMFEYLMPMLYMKAYPETLFYETYRGCVYSQIKYANENKIPFGISESGFYEFDNNLNYQYKAFGVPTIAMKKDYENLVVSPYSSIMSAMVDIKNSLKNLRNLRSLGCLGKYGFYEAIDFTKLRDSKNEGYSVVKSYMSHHQGMSFLSLANILMNNLPQNRFENIIEIESVCELLHESVLNMSIKDIKDNLTPISSFDDIEFLPTIVKYKPDKICDMQIYSNGNYSLGISSSGGGYLKYKNEYISKLSNDFTNENSYGNIYINDLSEEEFFSSTYLPCRNNDISYICEFELDKVRFRAKSKDISVTNEIFISKDEDVEIRKVIIKNLTYKQKSLELTSYFESYILNKKFDYIDDKMMVICGNDREDLFMGHSIYFTDEGINNIEFENSKDRFIGINGNSKNPLCMYKSSSYGNDNKLVDENIMSIRSKITLNSYSHISVYFINSINDSKERVIQLIDKYRNVNMISNLIQNNAYNFKIMLNNLKIFPSELSLFNNMISKIIYGYPNKTYELERDININDLISHNIDPNIPMVSVEITNIKDLENVEILMKALVYFMRIRLEFNLIILNSYLRYDKYIDNEINKFILKYNLKDKINVNNGVYIILSNLYKNTYNIIKSISNIFIESSKESIYDQIGVLTNNNVNVMTESSKNLILPSNNETTNKNKVLRLNKYLFETANEISDYNDITKYSIPKRVLKFYNSYGGFSKDYEEYVIKLNNVNLLPHNYRNILRNKYISTSILASGIMQTWAFDSKEFLLTGDYSDSESNLLGEGIYIREEEDIWSPTLNPVGNNEDYIVSYSYFETSIKNKYRNLNTLFKCFVPEGKKYKIVKLKFQNTSQEERVLNIYYFAPIFLGGRDDYSKKLSTYIQKDFEYIYGENKFSKDFKNIKAYLKLFGCYDVSFTGSKKEFLGINNGMFMPKGVNKHKLSNLTGICLESCLCVSGKIHLKSNETKEVYVMFGYDDNINGINFEINNFCKNEKLFKDLYNENLFLYENNYKEFNFKTEDEYLDGFLNGWALHQNNNEKFLLNNSFNGELNSCIDIIEKCFIYNYTNPIKSKKNIIRVFSNMYEDGTFKDKWSCLTKKYEINDCLYDLLWIVYVLIDYIKVTNDFEILNFEIKFVSDNDLKVKFSNIYNKCLTIINRGIYCESLNSPEVLKSINDVPTLFLLYKVMEDFEEILDKFNDSRNKIMFSKVKESLLSIFDNECFNGEFYINNLKDGIKNNNIYLLPQVLSLFCIKDNNIRNKVIYSIDKYLVNKDRGFVREYFKRDVGFMKNLENIQDSKTVILLSKALCDLNLNDKAYKYLNFLNPIIKTIDRNGANVYRKEPYIIPSKIEFRDGVLFKIINEDFNYPSSLFYRVCIQNILGFNLCSEGFYIDPHIPSNWKSYVMEYKREDAFYKIIVRRGENKSLKINGEKYVENFIEFDKEGDYIIDITI